jgi:hypothetical protein
MSSSGDTSPVRTPPGESATHGDQPATAFVEAGWKLSAESLTVTALFDTRAGVETALDALYTVGLPRDLIEVVVSPEAAAHFPAGVARRGGRETFRFAGIGGLTGLVLGAAISLGMVAWPGLEAPGEQAIVQLLGPNVGLVTGAALGAAAGFFRHRRPDPRHARAAEAAGAIVVAVTIRSEDEGSRIIQLLARCGGREPQVQSGP